MKAVNDNSYQETRRRGGSTDVVVVTYALIDVIGVVAEQLCYVEAAFEELQHAQQTYEANATLDANGANALRERAAPEEEREKEEHWNADEI